MYDERYDEIDERIHPCRGCEDYDPLNDSCKSNGGCAKPLTNADRIRSMTDEELVELCTNIDCECCKAIMHSKGCPANNWRRCEDFWLNWLKQEVAE